MNIRCVCVLRLVQTELAHWNIGCFWSQSGIQGQWNLAARILRVIGCRKLSSNFVTPQKVFAPLLVQPGQRSIVNVFQQPHLYLLNPLLWRECANIMIKHTCKHRFSMNQSKGHKKMERDSHSIFSWDLFNVYRLKISGRRFSRMGKVLLRRN